MSIGVLQKRSQRGGTHAYSLGAIEQYPETSCATPPRAFPMSDPFAVTAITALRNDRRVRPAIVSVGRELGAFHSSIPKGRARGASLTCAGREKGRDAYASPLSALLFPSSRKRTSPVHVCTCRYLTSHPLRAPAKTLPTNSANTTHRGQGLRKASSRVDLRPAPSGKRPEA